MFGALVQAWLGVSLDRQTSVPRCWKLGGIGFDVTRNTNKHENRRLKFGYSICGLGCRCHV